MDKKQEKFLRELLNDFQVEAEEHYVAIVNCIIGLEKDPPEAVFKKSIEQAYREMHSLKGAARAVSLVEVERVCQSLESVFSRLKEQTIETTPLFFDTVHQAMDVLNSMLSDVKTGNRSVRGEQTVKIIGALQSIRSHDTGNTKPAAEQAAAEASADPAAHQPESGHKPAEVGLSIPGTRETVRVSVEKLADLLLRTEEFVPVKSELAYNVKLVRQIRRELKGKATIAGSEEVNSTVKKLEELSANLDLLKRNSTRMIDDLLASIRGTLLFPFSSVLDLLPKMVRDLSHDQGKQVSLTIAGGETEIDRRVLEEVKDPFIHLVRNCIDHGIELPATRLKNGKPSTGTLLVSVTKMDRYIEIEIRDDGAGMNRKNILEAALQNGFMTREKGEALSDREVFNLALLSGISTSRFITDLSGRGLGLAIVAEKVNLLGGDLTIESEPGNGTVFFIRLPLKLATFRGILIRLSDHFFLVPDNFIEKAIRIDKEALTSIEDQKVIMVAGVPVPVKHLGQLLDIPVRRQGKSAGGLDHALILASGAHRIAFLVDEILEEEEGIVKNPGGVLKNARSITGATILGNGRVVPILNVPDLLETGFGKRETISSGDAVKDDPEAGERQRHILVAEDSITARSLLRNILESSGFIVKTAVDGLEAFMHLKNGEFDLVVSDVEMPNMNGFELITKIREDSCFSDLPVILVTALESVGDRQRGMDCGANAYIVKSNFEQSNLLEVIGRLI